MKNSFSQYDVGISHEEINRSIAKFLANGGKIKVLRPQPNPIGPSLVDALSSLNPYEDDFTPKAESWSVAGSA